ncbi:hypothetical protein PRIPAC_97503, partial [Pristionchus pacificus]|uniref:phosphogluconate dehydrogenase (NADP(+)-dependent, decarboxylating) n=1 Tax=Pristionchus pacificus TaxID=54126 RepID=A0A2A6D1G1_PRIPA
ERSCSKEGLVESSSSLKRERPRRIVILVKAGAPVQAMIDSIVPFLEAGDIIIDSGNSEYTDSNVGEAGSGHFVKMVHNGIEYGDMQLIAEAHHLLKDAEGLNHEQMADVMDEWNKGELDSFLIEITANIFRFKDEKGETLLPKIRYAAGQKGTGKWTCFASLEYGIPVTLIGEAEFARCLSALKGERVRASKELPQSDVDPSTLIKDKKEFIKAIQQDVYASKIASYAQGFMLLAEASKQFGWNLNYGAIALMWRGGCIIRSRFLGDIKKAFDSNPNLANLLDNFFKDAVAKAHVRFFLCFMFNRDDCYI